MQLSLGFREITIQDVPSVGGKNAALGEMYQKLVPLGVRVPNGFAVTADAYDYFLEYNNLKEKIKEILEKTDIYQLESLQNSGSQIRSLIEKGEFPEDLKKDILAKFEELEKEYGGEIEVAVRSSATAEDLPDASFAGQQETFLNVKKDQLLEKIKLCFASLFTDRAIFYREEKGFDHFQVKLSVGVQKMVRSDLASSGVMFTLDPDSGLDKVIIINSIFGLGELIVQGRVIPDEFIVFKQGLKKGFNSIISKKLGKKDSKIVYAEEGTKLVETSLEEKNQFSLTDEEVLELAKFGLIIEEHFQKAMDIEWAKDGKEGKIYIVQARPETVYSAQKKTSYEEYRLKGKGKIILTGISVGSKITHGKVRVIKDLSKINEFQEGEILVTEMTDPDWVPIMKKAKGIITDKGARTCFTGETMILTNKGFLPIKEIVANYQREKIKVLTLNPKTFSLEWKEVIDGFVQRANVIRVNVSQTGRARNNFLEVTPDHKFFTFEQRKLVKEEIKKIIETKKSVLSLTKIPALSPRSFVNQLGYLLGVIFTDGHIFLSKNHGEVQFIQKENSEKRLMIEKVINYWKTVFGKEIKKYKEIETVSIIRGKKIIGKATKFRFYSKQAAQKFKRYFHHLDKIILTANKEFLLEFLAGVIDGDGSFQKKEGRIHIYISKEKLLQAVVLACLRLGISYQVYSNRNIYNVQLVDNFDQIFQFTARVKGKNRKAEFSSILFNAKQLLADIVYKVNYQGKIKPYVTNNLLIGKEKIIKYIIPLVKGQIYNHELTKIVKSPLKMLRVSKIDASKETEVYNITVQDNHNYIVFTSKYTPIIVANCHAAIVSRELQIPCIVGTQKATEVLQTGQEVTIDCSQGITGYVYEGALDYEVIEHDLEKIPETKTRVMVNIGTPEEAWQNYWLPVKGVGLAREEFIIAEEIKIHPLALIDYPNLPEEIKNKIDELTQGFDDKKEFYIQKLAEGIAKIASAFYPHEILLRFSDFKSNEYRNLIGGEIYEPEEANPMIGFRGSSRYYHPKFKPAFELEVLAVKRAIFDWGLDNISLLVPFCRTPEEGKKVISIITQHIDREKVKIYVMCEIPSNVLLAEEFLEIFDGFSIGSNDLSQLTLGIDRDSEIIGQIANETNPAVKKLMKEVVEIAKVKNKYSGICGQAPSDFPEIVEFLIKAGIKSISFNPDAVIKGIEEIKKIEEQIDEN